VEFLSKPRTWVVIGVAVAAAFLVQQLWVWEVERVEVPPDQFLVRIGLWGKDLPEGDILAPDESYKGVMKDVLPEGRHFLNPLLWDYETHKVTVVPAGKCLVLTRKAGTEISADRLARGEFLAGEGERGIVREVRLPGKYRINPYEYDSSLADAVEIRAHQVGVHTLKWGKDPGGLKGDNRNPYVVPEGYRGVQEKPLPPGTYYFNPYVEAVVPVDTRSHPVEFTDIQFPSRDGFHIQPHVLVAYKVLPEKAPELFVTLSDKGQLHQESETEEQKKKNEILQKVVLPLIRGSVRIEGSKFDARDFISQKSDPLAAKAVNPRERLQRELMEKVTPRCKELGIVIDSISLADLEPSEELTKLAEQISERERTRVVREKNRDLIAQYQQDQERAATEALKRQNQELVEANTKLKVEKEKAEQSKEVEEKKLKQELEAAQTRLEAARNQAKALVTKGKAEAAVINAQNEAEVSGLRTAVRGFPSADEFAQYHVLSRLAPALTEIFASDTSDFARMFAAYMTPAKKVSAAPPRADASAAAAMPPASK
jgi:regulator of protease activity HflC (stomatin/prohibitin superfamily)